MSGGEGTPLVVLHDVGDEDAGSAWSTALERAGWPGPVVAPELPGHGNAQPPSDGSYDLVDAALEVVRASADRPTDGLRPVVLGVGVHGWAAQILALAGRAVGLVLVDGLNGPWSDAAGATDRNRAWLRSIAADPAALAPAPAGALDPRLRHGLPPHGDRRLAERAAAALDVPVLLVESERSPLAPSELDPVVARMADATVERIRERQPLAVAETTVSWWAGSGPPSR